MHGGVPHAGAAKSSVDADRGYRAWDAKAKTCVIPFPMAARPQPALLSTTDQRNTCRIRGKKRRPKTHEHLHHLPTDGRHGCGQRVRNGENGKTAEVLAESAARKRDTELPKNAAHGRSG